MIRPATSADVPAIYLLIRALAQYEHLEGEVTATEETLRAGLFGTERRSNVEAIVADDAAQVVGFALFFHNYSTFLARSGLYLEDLFVLPEYRRRGHGRALLGRLAGIAVERGCGRFEWSVLHWNEPAIAFYRSLGATLMDEWRIFRMTRPAFERLAQS
ncbi:MAG TPA: GNAT family N-acetyltransferase [Polyangiaceae bacterium]|nr:GNAT family N-acetyltransferase [Polyangiaceae bacterium]